MRSKNLPDLDLPVSLLSGCPIAKQSHLHHRWLIRLCALYQSIYVLSAFDYGHSRLAQEKLTLVPLIPSPLLQYPLPLRHALIRHDVAKLRAFLHLFLGDRACYAESFALCAGLRILGWDCVLVSGYAHMHMHGPTAMHAWVEYEGEAISDRVDVPIGYIEIERRGLLA